MDVITESLVGEVFGMPCRVVTDVVSATPMVLPIGRHNDINAATEHGGVTSAPMGQAVESR